MAKIPGSNALGMVGYTALGSNGWQQDMENNLRGLDGLVQAVVVSMSLTAPPVASDGACYIPADGATGLWSGKANQFTRYNGAAGAWEFWAPKNGWAVYCMADGKRYAWNGIGWNGDFKNAGGGSFSDDLTVYGDVNCTATGSFVTVSSSAGYYTGGVQRISSVGAGFLTALSISGLTNGKLVMASTAAGLLADSSFGEDATYAKVTGKQFAVFKSVPYGTAGSGFAMSSSFEESQYAVDQGQPWRIFLQPRKTSGVAGIVSLGVSTRGASNASVDVYPLDFTGSSIIANQKLILAPAAAGYASLNIPTRTAPPSAPIYGDIWNDGYSIFLNGMGLLSNRGASDSVGVGSFFQLQDALTATKAWIGQLGASNSLDLWNYNGSWSRRIQFLQDGGASFAGALTLNGASRFSFASSYANSLQLDAASNITSINNSGNRYVGLSLNHYWNGTQFITPLAGTGANIPANLMINTDGSLAFATSLSNPTAGGVLSDLAMRFNVSRQGGVGFFGTTAPTSRPAVTGSRGGNAALASLLTHLAACGLVTDSTTA